MLLSDIRAANDLAGQLRDIDNMVASLRDVQILLSGKPLDPPLLAQIRNASRPIVMQYFQAARADVIAKLNALGVTES